MLIQINEDIRIRDYDDKQYVLEKRYVSKGSKTFGEVSWVGKSYCGSLNSLVRVTRELLGQIAADKACTDAQELFDGSVFPDQINALPPKITEAA